MATTEHPAAAAAAGLQPAVLVEEQLVEQRMAEAEAAVTGEVAEAEVVQLAQAAAAAVAVATTAGGMSLLQQPAGKDTTRHPGLCQHLTSGTTSCCA